MCVHVHWGKKVRGLLLFVFQASVWDARLFLRTLNSGTSFFRGAAKPRVRNQDGRLFGVNTNIPASFLSFSPQKPNQTSSSFFSLWLLCLSPCLCMCVIWILSSPFKYGRPQKSTRRKVSAENYKSQRCQRSNFRHRKWNDRQGRASGMSRVWETTTQRDFFFFGGKRRCSSWMLSTCGRLWMGRKNNEPTHPSLSASPSLFSAE